MVARTVDRLHRLFTALSAHDHQAMASCYHTNARFRDIAFSLAGIKQIHAMWHMISETDIRCTFEVVRADEEAGTVNLVDDYTFAPTGHSIHNIIVSQFRLKDGCILEHQDVCDARAWGRMALGGLAGFVAGRLRIVRSFQAQRLLRAFTAKHPEYQ
jgi:hypothetical protein